MYGYVKINKPEMKVKEYELYRGLYCSLCKALGKYFGILSRLTLSYDITFLVLSLLSFSSSHPCFESGRCAFNPIKKCNYCKNADEELKYASSMSMMLFYFKVIDNIHDSSFFKRLPFYLILPYAKSKYKKAKSFYPEIASEIEACLSNQRKVEEEKTTLSDKAAHYSADALGKIFLYKTDDKNIYRFGYGIGKFVYLCDAADDIEKDIKNGSYNCFAEKYNLKESPSAEIKEDISGILNLSASVAREAFSDVKEKTLSSLMENIIFEGLEISIKKVLKGKEANERSL